MIKHVEIIKVFADSFTNKYPWLKEGEEEQRVLLARTRDLDPTVKDNWDVISPLVWLPKPIISISRPIASEYFDLLVSQNSIFSATLLSRNRLMKRI